jgi:hypothetical protein
LVFAAVEIEIEGKWGWAEKAPTWYRTTGWAAKVYGLFMGGKPLTGYHAFMFFMTAMIFHIQFFMGTEWSATAELKAWAMYFAWCPLWDYLWFVLNPYYGVWNFKKENVWWHAKNFKGFWIFSSFPVDYFIGWGASLLFAFAAGLVGDIGVFTQHIQLLLGFLFFTLVTILAIAPLYQWWYKKMRERDDRDKAGIFHRLD